jgi:hypothetical protein
MGTTSTGAKWPGQPEPKYPPRPVNGGDWTRPIRLPDPPKGTGGE